MRSTSATVEVWSKRADYDASMVSLPAGTVTFVFTDIEGSTALVKSLGDRYGELLTQHRRLVRDTFGASGGVEIDTQGDAFFFAFPRAREAVAAAVEVQRAHASAEWPDGARVRMRIGLHTGEPAIGDEGYHGLDVVRAARICAVAHGGAVAVSESTRALVGSSLPEGVSVFPLGERHLKGLDDPERVYELEIEGVSTAAPDPAPTPEPRMRSKTKEKRGRPTFDQRAENFGERLAERIQEGVFRIVDRSLPKGPEAPSEDLDDLADRASTLEDRIRQRVEEGLRASGIDPDELER